MSYLHVPLYQQLFEHTPQLLVKSQDFTVHAWTYPGGVHAVSLENSRGRLVVLPWQGQMIWSADFDGQSLTMKNMFQRPRPTATVIGTYGCFMFHSGLLRNGCPAPQDTHALHGEMPCAAMDNAWLEVDADEQGPLLRLCANHEYVQGFGDHYRASPTVTVRPDSGLFEIAMNVANLAGQPMDLMYMAHMNYAYIAGARLSGPREGARIRARTSVPGHVKPTPQWSRYLAELAEHPASLQVLDSPHLYDPEIVCFIDEVGSDKDGYAHFFLDHPNGAAFYTRYRPEEFDHATRWILHNCDQQVAAFVLPATCEPEGFEAESAKGNVRSLAAGATAHFSLTTGYLSAQERRALGR